MPNPRNSSRGNLGLLPNFGARSIPFTVSLAVNTVAGAAFVWVAMSGIHEHVEVPKFETAAFVFPAPAPPVVEMPQPRPKEIVQAAPPKLQVATAPVRLPLSEIAPQPQVHLAESSPATAPMPELPAASPKAFTTQRAPAVFHSAKPVVAVFHSSATAATGSFGSPAGVVANPNAGDHATIAAVGSFQQAEYSTQGANALPSGSVRSAPFSSGITNESGSPTGKGAAKSVQFGSGVGGATGAPAQRGKVTGTDFNTASPVATSVQLAIKPQGSSFVSPIVTFEPHPQYTPEALRSKVQGEVIFEVRLTAKGKIEVLRKVSGLGYGLDEEALSVVRRIQFQPAVKDGQAADLVTLVHIAFRVA